MTPVQQLRGETQAYHDRVDAVFGQADLANPADYARLLTAHARALLPAETALERWTGLPVWPARGGAIRADLAAMGVAIPPPLPFVLSNGAAAWGALYVLEGSRLGNAMLERRVAAGLPRAYLAARHGQGGWRAMLAAFDSEGKRAGPDWLDRAVAGAKATFALYLEAGRAISPAGG